MNINMWMYVPDASDAYADSIRRKTIITQRKMEEIIKIVSSRLNDEIKQGHFTVRIEFSKILYPDFNLFEFLQEIAKSLVEIGYQTTIEKDNCIRVLTIDWRQDTLEAEDSSL